VIGSGIFQFSQAQVYVFLLEVFVYFSFLAHFAVTSPVVFAELTTVPLRNKHPKIYAKYAYAFAHTHVCVSAYVRMRMRICAYAYLRM